MKKQFLSMITITTILLTMSGCQVIEEFKEGYEQEMKKQEEIQQKVEKSNIPPLTKNEYVSEIVTLQTELKDSFTAFGEAMETLTSSQEIDHALNKVNQIREIVDKFEILNAPDEFKIPQEEFLLAMDLFRKGLDKMEEYLTVTGQPSTYEEAAEYLSEAQDHYSYAFAVIDLTEDLPVVGGDGTLSSSDLEALDNIAGMDRRSVLLNISKDGHELVGKWGFFNDDGTFNISIVIHENGQYEGYGNGKYPNDPMEGTWNYNYLKRTLVFDHVGDIRSFNMDVQSFKDNTIRLMDLDSLRTFDYVKEGQ
ncbi:DUF3994 domain-containing protein [Caldalkalibacillus mannanilyticus]|uniref:DUF3994 domain-containing protein n=1 Tax=Caldalkalibacillus mannanilyticus TaxID=1418 RepID=UPI00046A41D8|nr:DUF3994 domain-containing protein [Caldalkalibacillus mannanilyticus]